MGIHGIYQEISHGARIALSKFAVQKFEETGRPLRIAIDVSIWLFQIQASKGGTNPAPRTFYYRLLRLIALCIHPVFVFDGPNKPPFKRGKRTGGNVSSIPDFLAKQLIKQFGFPIHYAPGEAEAECALLQREGIVDVVLSEDVDTLMFGSGAIIRNWSPEHKSAKTPTHVNLYEAKEIKSGPSGLDREGMILVALMSGGDYVPEGIPGCGPKTACEAARAGFGADLCKIKRSDKNGYREWRERLQHELRTNEGKLFKRRHTALKIPADFPRLDILGYYTHPVVSTQAGLDSLRRTMNWDREIDFPGLRTFTHDAFDWIRLEGAKHFIRSLAPSLVVRGLRMRAEGQGLSSDDLAAVQEDEATLIKGIHGKRQHTITDGESELRVSFTPLELVRIDLSQEDPDETVQDEIPASTQSGESADLELDAMELEDEEGPRKRGPTKFDPSKPARAWVLETYVKAGVPLTAEDWEAGRSRPKRVVKAVNAKKATSTTSAPKTRGRKVGTDSDLPQTSISQFTKVVKPGARLGRSLAKLQEAPLAPLQATQTSRSRTPLVIDVLSSSPPSIPSVATMTAAREKSQSPIPELPPSITKRRRRGPMQRSRTLPADLDNDDSATRPRTPPLLSTIETLDLVSSPAGPSPSPFPAKKAKTTSTNSPLVARVGRQKSITASPGKGRQTTLDTWCSPSKDRITALPRDTAPPAPPRFGASKPKPTSTEIESLDLTLSSSPQPPNRRLSASASAPRPPLHSISSNTSFSSTSTSTTTTRSTHAYKRPSKSPPRKPLRTSPRLRNPSPKIDTLDLTLHSSPSASNPPSNLPPAHRPQARTSTSPPSPPPLTRTPPSSHRHETKQKKRLIQLRKSLPGRWDIVDAPDTPGPASGAGTSAGGGGGGGGGGGAAIVLKGKERRRWRESEIEVLDLC